MINHILVPLDGSTLAECVLPHVCAIAHAFDERITLLHIVTLPPEGSNKLTIDSFDWLLRKRESKAYLDKISTCLHRNQLNVNAVILDGLAAQCIIEYAQIHDVDLIAISTHGQSGLSRWNINSVIQKVILGSYKSILLVRAYQAQTLDYAPIHYQRLFVGLDCSTRAEYVLPIALRLAQVYDAKLVLGTVVQKPELICRFLPADDDVEFAARVTDGNYSVASQYLEKVYSQFSCLGVDLQLRLIVSNKIATSLHDTVEQEGCDLVLLVAHGHSGECCWPYGSIATNFINYGSTALLIAQDLSGDEIKQTQAEFAAQETQGH